MRISEIISANSDTQLDEGVREKLGAAALAAGVGLGGFGIKHYLDKDSQPTPQAQQTQQAKVSKSQLNTMSPEQIRAALDKVTSTVSWAPNELQQFMAQVSHETAGFRNMTENLYYESPKRLYKIFTSAFRKNPQAANNYVGKPQELANLVYAGRMGNGDVGSGDGWRYRGRGLLHITGKEMYSRVGRGIGVDLVGNPDLLATDPEVSMRAAIWYWKNIVLPKVQGKNKQFTDTGIVTKAINPAGAGMKSRKEKFKQEVQRQDKQ